MTPAERHDFYQSTLENLVRANAATAAILREETERRYAETERRRNAGPLRRLTWNPFAQAAAFIALPILAARFLSLW
jgi:hypothetical protein